MNVPAAQAQEPGFDAPAPTNLLEGCTYRGRGPGNDSNAAGRLADSLCWLPADKLASGEPLTIGNYELRYNIHIDRPIERFSNSTYPEAFFGNPKPKSSNGTGVFITEPNGVHDVMTFRKEWSRNDERAKISITNIKLVDKTTGQEVAQTEFFLAAADAETSTTNQENWGFQSDVEVLPLQRALGTSSRGNNRSCDTTFRGPLTGRGYINLDDNQLYSLICAPRAYTHRGSFVAAAKKPRRFEITMGLPRNGGEQAVAFALVLDRMGGDVHPKAQEHPMHGEYDTALTSLEAGLSGGARTGFNLTATYENERNSSRDQLLGNFGRYLPTPRVVNTAPGSNEPIQLENTGKTLVYRSQAENSDPVKAMKRYRPEWVCRTPSADQVRIRESVHQVRENPNEVNPQPGSEQFRAPTSGNDNSNKTNITLNNIPETGVSELRIPSNLHQQFGGIYCRVDWQPRFRSAALNFSKVVVSDWADNGFGDAERVFQIGYACRVDRVATSTSYSNEEFIDAYAAESELVSDAEYPVKGVVSLKRDEQQSVVVPERMQCQFSEMLPEIDREVPGQTVTPGVVINGNQYRGGEPFRAPHLSIKDNNDLWYTDGGAERQLNLSMIDVDGDFSSRTPTSYDFALTNNYRHAKTAAYLDNNIKSGEFPVNVVEPSETKIIRSELTCPGTPFAETIEFPVTNHGSELDYQTRHNISGAPAGRDCVLTATDEGGKPVISRDLQLNGEQVPPAETDENGVALSFRFRFPLPEGTRAAELPALILTSNYVDDRKADFELSKHIDGVSDPRGLLNPGGAVLPSDATVMPMQLRITNSGELPLPLGHDGFHMSDATLAGKTLTIGGVIENFQVSGGTQVVVPSDGNLGEIYDDLQCTINRPEVAQPEPEDSAIDSQVLAPGEHLDCAFAVAIAAEPGEAYSYPEDNATREFYVSYQREGHETVEKEAKYSATRMSKLIDQMLPNTGVQTMVWILGLGLLALLFGLWRYLREEKEEN
ncbi:LPXTG cell wall anchor domain-containing protein [Corynebacterium propinquum]